MTIKIKNWKLALLALVLFCAFLSLGFWQLSRAKQKEILIHSFEQRTATTPLAAQQLIPSHDLRFYRTTLTGHFDNQHTLLLDNKILHGKIGYEVYTLFYANNVATPILVDRGFIPMPANRLAIPDLRSINGTVNITGMLNLPPTYVALGSINESTNIKWPLRVEYVDFAKLTPFIKTTLFPYLLMLTPENPAAYALEWQIVAMPPEKHRGYAVQWFALALTLLILFVALNRDSNK